MLKQMVDPTNPKKEFGTFRLRTMPEGIEVASLNDTFEGFKEIKDSAALAKVIEENLDNTKMYNDASLFVKLDVGNEQNKPLMDLLEK